MDTEKLFRFAYGCDPGLLAGTVIVTPFISPSYFEKYCEKKTSFKGMTYSGFTAKKSGSPLAVVHCGIGDRLMGDAVLLLESAPVEGIVFAGSCGGLAGSRIGDIVIAKSAFDGEGFSRYLDRSFSIKEVMGKGRLVPSSSGYTHDLAGFLMSRKTESPVREGDIFTIGSLLAEGKNNIEAITGGGFIGIDMELSAVYSAAEAAGIKAAGILFISDMPLARPLGEKLTQEEKADYNRAKEEVIRSSVEFACLNAGDRS